MGLLPGRSQTRPRSPPKPSLPCSRFFWMSHNAPPKEVLLREALRDIQKKTASRETIQNRAARIVARTVRRNPAMDVLKWPTLEERRRNIVFKLVKKSLQGQCPQYFKEYFKRNNTIYASAVRQSNLLHPPTVRTEIAKRSLYYYGCTLFNELS